MYRLLVNLLVALALLMQAGSGVLAVGGASCHEAKAPAKQCCAAKATKATVKRCPCHPQRDRCSCSAPADNRATPVAGPRTVNVPGEVAAVPLVAPEPRCFVIAHCAVLPYCRLNESPPRVVRAVSLPLLI
ncbi:MAG: hypothetical protein Q8L55_08345 [Phycisphaerales bacterium]|nr:hypothetical protein [Phycisphaerales bacterium]